MEDKIHYTFVALPVFQHTPTYHVSVLQTGEMGLTQSVGEEGLRFEVWVRQTSRTKYCLTLQALSSEEREAWTHDIAQLLWTHAIHNTGERSTLVILF